MYIGPKSFEVICYTVTDDQYNKRADFSVGSRGGKVVGEAKVEEGLLHTPQKNNLKIPLRNVCALQTPLTTRPPLGASLPLTFLMTSTPASHPLFLNSPAPTPLILMRLRDFHSLTLTFNPAYADLSQRSDKQNTPR